MQQKVPPNQEHKVGADHVEISQVFSSCIQYSQRFSQLGLPFLQELTLVMGEKIKPLPHSVHQTAKSIKHSRAVNVNNSLRARGLNWLSFVMSQRMHCPLET